MRSIVVRALALLLVPLSVMVAPTADAGDPVKILIFGDSITQGSSGDWTWRYFLDRHLHEVGVPFDFVGPRDGLHHVPEVSGATFPDEQTYADPAFDTDHAAVWGQALTSPVEDAGDLAATYQPDVVVAMMGLNDLLWQGDAVADLIAQWRSDIAALREANPGVRVVLVQLPQTWHPAVVPYDAALVDLAAELDTPSSRVAATPLPAFDVDVDTWDGNHPSASGTRARAAARSC